MVRDHGCRDDLASSPLRSSALANEFVGVSGPFHAQLTSTSGGACVESTNVVVQLGRQQVPRQRSCCDLVSRCQACIFTPRRSSSTPAYH
ncbi:MAG: hypothetical protein ACK55I_24805, partial [bacterium]